MRISSGTEFDRVPRTTTRIGVVLLDFPEFWLDPIGLLWLLTGSVDQLASDGPI